MSVADNYFEKLYKGSEDPWSFRERWYEQRKRNLTLAALPRSHYGSIFEPGCANGELSARLAERCTQLLCSDTSAIALELAHNRLAHRSNVRLLQTRLPEQWPAGRFDLIVLSELCYYLDAQDLDRLIGRQTALGQRPEQTGEAHDPRNHKRRQPEHAQQVLEDVAEQGRADGSHEGYTAAG